MDGLAGIRTATERDAATAAGLHVAHVTGGFLPTLGPRFLGLLYRRVVRSSSAFLLVADPGPGSDPVGFLAGATDLRRLYGEFLRGDGLPAAAVAAPRLVRAAPLVLETLRYGLGRRAPAAVPPGDDGAGPTGSRAPGDVGHRRGEAELMALAVDPACRRQGIGAALVAAFVDRLATAGAATARVVVGADNAAAMALYRAQGFEPAAELQVHAGVRSLVLRRHLSGSTAAWPRR